MKMQGDDPPFLTVGTDVSAKYKGAFCEAKIKKVVRNIKCKLSLKVGGGVLTVTDDLIKGTLRVGSTVEVKQDPKKEAAEAIITKIQDCSQYTVVFDDGDITTLRRSALCLKSGRHFNESETLDQLPLTHPEHFSTPVIAGRRGRRGRAQSDESEGEPSARTSKADSAEREPHVGRVVLVEAASGGERRRPQQPAFPALVVAPTPQIKVKEDYLVRSFKDGRYYTVPKKEAREFRKGGAPLEWAGVDAALQYLNNGVLPPHWDRDALFNESKNTSDDVSDSSDDEPREEKDHFVAQLYKFMDDRGTPLNRNPTIANRDIDLYRLFRVTQKLGGYNRVSNQNQWKNIADKMGFHPVTNSITNLCKQAYKKYLHSFEDFYRKLGVTLVAHPRGARTPPAGRSLIRDRDKQIPTSSSASSTPTGTPHQRVKDREKDSDKSETDRSEKEDKEVSQDKPERKEKIEKPKEIKSGRTSDGEDSADNQPLAGPSKTDKEKEKAEKEKAEMEKELKEKEKEKEKEIEEKKEKEKELAKEKEKVPEEKPATPIVIKPRSQSKTRSLPPIKSELIDEKRTPKPRRPMSSKGDGSGPSVSRAPRRPHASTDSDSSGRASRQFHRCAMTKKMQSRRSQSANSASSGNTIASTSSKRPRKRKNTEPSANEPLRVRSNVKAQVGDKLLVYYGPVHSKSMVTYEAKVTEISAEGMLRVHYTGWNTRYDEWIKPQSIAANITQRETTHNKKVTSNTRRVRPKRTEAGPSVRSDSDSDTDSEVDVKRPPKKSIDDKASGSKTPFRPKESKSSDSSSSTKARKRPARLPAGASALCPAKKPRPAAAQGRDYDLNEIRSELKGLHSVKQEPEEIKQELTEREGAEPADVPAPDKQPEDVYEFKEPEPFELELHDEKKKRTHRIFDDISPSKYTSTLSKSLSEEISEDPLRARLPLRSPSLSPFRDFSVRDAPGLQGLEDDSKDGLFSLDDDSFPGDGSSGPIFEGFTPAKNQETYSKKSKVSKLMKLIDDSPDSPADDEQSSDDDDVDDEDVIMKEDSKQRDSSPDKVSEEPVKKETDTKDEPDFGNDASVDLDMIPLPTELPPPKLEMPKLDVSPKTIIPQIAATVEIKEEQNFEDIIPLSAIPLPNTPPPSIIILPNITPRPSSMDIKDNPKSKESTIITLHKFKETTPKTKESTPKVKEIAPKVKEIPPKLKEIPLKAKEIPPKVKEIPPKLKEISPKNKETSPKVKETSPKAKETSPKAKETSPKAKETSPKAKETSPKAKETSPKAKETSPKAKETSPKIKETYPKFRDAVPKDIITKDIIPKDIIPKVKEIAPKIKEANTKVKLEDIKLPDKEPEAESPKKLELPSSPLIDTEEDKSEPDSPARIDVLPEPPPGFLLYSEGPKIAEKLLKAINSAKRLSLSPPPVESRPKTPKKDDAKPKTEDKISPIPDTTKKTEPAKARTETPKKEIRKTPDVAESIFGEPSKFTDTKLESSDVKKVKPKEPTPPRIDSPLDILERRKSVADLPLVAPGKNNKVLSDTIQKLSSQINQAAANMPPISLPTFPSADRSDSSDSDDSDRRLIIGAGWATGARGAGRAGGVAARSSAALAHAGKSPGEWSAGESLLMLEDACKNERKHSASVVVAGSGANRVLTSAPPGAAEEDSNISLLLCEETIPGSPAPDAEPAPPRHRLHMPFASATLGQHSAEERRAEAAAGGGVPAAGAGAAGGVEAARAGPRREAPLDRTPPTTPDSLDLSPSRERRISGQDSPAHRKEEDEENRPNDTSAMDIDKPNVGPRSRKASESSCAGAAAPRRGRRPRRDTDDHAANPTPAPPLKYNFYVDLDPSWDSQRRINVLTSRLADLRKAYHSVKAELAAIDRRRKKLRRKEREAVKAAKAACS